LNGDHGSVLVSSYRLICRSSYDKACTPELIELTPTLTRLKLLIIESMSPGIASVRFSPFVHLNQQMLLPLPRL
jgi:hypothetical protein